MPYTIETDPEGFAVLNEESVVLGRYATRTEALNVQRSLYGVARDVVLMGRVKEPEFTKSSETLIAQHDKLHAQSDNPTDAQLFVHHSIMSAIKKSGQECDCSCGKWSEPLLIDLVETDLETLSKSDNPSLAPVKEIIQTAIDNGYQFADVLQMLDIGGYMIVVRPKEIQEITEEPTSEVDADPSDSILKRISDLLDKVGEPSLAGSVAEGGSATISGVVTDLFKAEEKRFTLGPWYIPDKKDAHGEFTDTHELQNALWNYVKSGDRRIRLQHNKSVIAGEWLEVVTWPYEVTLPMNKADGSTEQVTYPAGTVFMGTQWQPWAWELVKKGKLTGFSIGGKAERLYVEMDEPVTKEEGFLPPNAQVDDIIPQEEMRISAPLDDEIKSEPSLTAGDVATIVADALKSFSPTIQVVLPDNKPKNRTIVRDEHGFITGMVEE